MSEERRSALEVLRGSRLLATPVGVASLIAGAVLLLWPQRTILVVARMVGVFVALVGVAELIGGLTAPRGSLYRRLVLVRGGVNTGAGALLLFWPGVTVTVLVWILGVDLVVTALLGLVTRGQAPPEARSQLTTRSVITLAFGIVIMAWPDATLNAVALIVGAGLGGVGVLLVWSGHRLRAVEEDVEEHPA